MAAKVTSFHARESDRTCFLFNRDLEVSDETVSHIVITDMKEKLKELSLLFAVKRTHSSVSYFIQRLLWSAATLLCFTVSKLIQ